MIYKKVAIIGRPNVGKSRFFNRLTQHKTAIVHSQPGVTRDRIVNKVEWLNRYFELIDTGGISSAELSFQANINEQAKIAALEADLVLMMVSYQDGLTFDDRYVAQVLKKLKPAKIFLLVNKAENYTLLTTNHDFLALGFGEPFYLSAEHGINVGDVLDAIVKFLQIDSQLFSNNPPLRFSLIGCPNVGKSSLANAILNQNRLIVSPTAHTTRDAIDCLFTYQHENYCLIDTAGIRRSGQANKQAVEKFAVLRAKKAIARSQCILLVLDIATGLTEQDEVVGGLAYKANIPTIIVANKWDAVVDKISTTMHEVEKQIRNKFVYLNWAPIIFLSAKEQTRIHTIFETLSVIKHQLQIKVATSMLDNVLMKAQVLNPIPNVGGKKIRLTYGVQVLGTIPTFVIFCNDPQLLHFSYARFIENQIRNAFEIDKVPITIYYKSKNARIRSQ